MSKKERDEKRRDNKGRLLKSGESQRPDGRYAYKYTDTFGEVKFVYSWKLVPTDKIPAGKRPDISLREKIKQIQKDLDDGIDTIGKKMTVCQLYEKYIRQRGNVKRGTHKSRQQLMKLLSDDKLGAASIDSVKLSDAKEWALRMQEKGVAYHTICNGKRSLKAIFYMAVQDDCLRKNPFDFQINEVINDDTVPKVPLTPAQEKELLEFMQNDPVYAKYYDEVLILLETGLRVSELCGLTPADLNFEKRCVNVDHQLLRSTEDGYYIEAPKTDSGYRQVPMSAAAYEAFQRVLHRRKNGKGVVVDGYKGFLFLNRDGLPKAAVHYDAMFQGLAKKFNKFHAAYILYQNGKRRHEPQGIAVHHGPFQYRYDAELLRPRHVPFRTGGNGTAASPGTDRRSSQRTACARERPGSPSRIKQCVECTTVCTTFESGNMRGNKNVCEVLPIGKVPEKPQVTSYTGI